MGGLMYGKDAGSLGGGGGDELRLSARCFLGYLQKLRRYIHCLM